MKTLTKKQRGVLDLIIQGEDKIDAVMRVYDCKSRASASVIAFKLYKNELFMNELRECQQKLREKTIEKESKFIDILKEFAPPVEVAKKLAELIFSGDKRTSDSAIEKWLKLSALYPDTKIGVYRDLEREREQVLSEVDIKKLIKAERLKDERLPVIEEGEVIEPSADKKDEVKDKNEGKKEQTKEEIKESG